MEEMKSIPNNNTKNEDNNKSANNIKGKTIEEQLSYYKSLCQKSKKLFVYYEDEIKQLKEKLSKYEGENGKVCELLFILKYANESFYFFKNNTTFYFINEKILSEQITKEMKSNPSIKTYDYIKDIKSKDEYLNQIIIQYEDKLKRISKENELNESKIKALKSQNDILIKELAKEKEKFDLTIQNSIQISNDVLIHLKNIFDVDLSDEGVKAEVYEKLKDNITNLINTNNLSGSSWFSELIQFNQKVLMGYLDSVFKIIEDDINKMSQKTKWQNTIDQLILNHEEEKNKMFKSIEQNKIAIRSLNQKINLLEQEKFNIAKQKDFTIEMLNKQINKGVNMNYLKNVFISFLTTKEESIQDGLLPVIFTTLQFNESEIKQVKQGREKNSNGLLSFFGK